MIVADANLIAYLFIIGPRTPEAEQVFEMEPVWVSPGFWRIEFENVLVTSIRARVISETQAADIWEKAQATIVTHQDPDPVAAVRLAISHRISAYDAQYVALAESLGALAVTGDRKLAVACPRHAVLMTDFIKGLK